MGGGSGGGSAGGGGGNSCTSDTWSNYAASFFVDYCANCHGSEFSAWSNVQSRSSTLSYYISSGLMPRGGGLSASERQRIVTWLDCGSPQ